MAPRLPRSLTRKRDELARERQGLRARLTEVDAELQALDYALRVVSPGWVPPKRIPRQLRKTLLPRGTVAHACLQFLRQRGELTTPELAQLIARQHRLTFASKEAEEDFASGVAMALRRYQRQGIVDVTDKNKTTQALRWRLKTDADGRLAVVGKAA